MKFSLGALIKGFFRWWGAELKSLVPCQAGEFFSSSIVDITLTREDKSWSVSRTFALLGSHQTLLDGPWDEIRETTFRAIRSYGPLVQITVSVSKDQCLNRTIAIPAQAIDRAESIALNDLALATPFDVENAYVSHKLSRNHDGHWVVEQFVLKKSNVKPMIDDLAKSGLSVRRINLHNPGSGTDILLSEGHTKQPAGLERWLVRAAVACAIVSAGLGAAVTGNVLQHQEDQIYELDQRTGVVRKEVVQMQERLRQRESKLQRAQSAQRRKLSEVTPLEVWEEVTHRLPDTAWIEVMRMERNQLHIVGFATSPETLIALLSASKLFDKVGFTASVTREANAEKERFQISMEVPSHAANETGAVSPRVRDKEAR